MGGPATYSGTVYQANLIAFICAHILARAPLDWFSPEDDTPSAVEPETGGPGDDLYIEFGSRGRTAEVQAKHGLSGGVGLADTVIAMLRKNAGMQRDSSGNMRAPEATTRRDARVLDRLVLAVDGTSSSTVRVTFAADLHRVRSGRVDALSPATRDLITTLQAEGLDTALPLLHVLTVEVDAATAPDTKHALHLLRTVLVDPSRAASVWAQLVELAHTACRDRLRLNRADLVHRLESTGSLVKAPAAEERCRRDLDTAERLRKRFANRASLRVLDRVGEELRDHGREVSVPTKVAYHIARSAAHIQLAEYDEGRRECEAALRLAPDSAEALARRSQIALAEGNIRDGKRDAAAATNADPYNELAWAMEAFVASASAAEPPRPPSVVAESERYRTTLVSIAAQHRAWPDVLRLTGEMLCDNLRPPSVLLARAHALLEVQITGEHDASAGALPIPSDPTERALEAERLTSEVLEDSDPDDDPRARQALLFRSLARQQLGDTDAAAADLTRLRAADITDPNAMLRQAVVLHQQDKSEEALAILMYPGAERHALLLALRAQLKAETGDVAGGRRDVEAALQLPEVTQNADGVRVNIASAACALHLWPLAESTLDAVPTAERDAIWHATQGRVLFARNDIEAGVNAFEQALTSSTGDARVAFASEYAVLLRGSGRPEAAAAVLEDFELGQLEDRVQRTLALAYMETGAFPKVGALLSRLANHGPLPPWALALASDLASQRDDTAGAISALRELVTRGAATAAGRLQLARLVAETDPEEATAILDQALAEELSPEEQMYAAQVLLKVHQEARALVLAIEAVRAEPDNGKLHRALIVLSLHADSVVPPEPNAVAADTHVVLTADDGQTLSYTIFSTPPVASARNEFLVGDPAIRELLGLTRGSVYKRYAGAWNEKRYTVTEITAASLFLVQDAMSHYEERFPGDPFMFMVSIGDEDSPSALAPILASLHQRRSHAETVIATATEKVLPLGLVAGVLGSSIPTVMDAVATDTRPHIPLWTEWSDAEGHELSFNAALALATGEAEGVLTASMLHHLELTGLLEAVRSLRLVAPTSLVLEFDELIGDRRGGFGRSTGVLAATDTGLLVYEDTTVTRDAELSRLERLRNWITVNARILVRPLEALVTSGTEEAELRELIGHASYDAVQLARTLPAVLVADDLGLRKMAGTHIKSTSSAVLANAMVSQGRLDSAARDGLYSTLLTRRAASLPMTTRLLVTLLTRPDVSREVGNRAVEAAVVSARDVSAAALLAAGVIKGVATAPVQVSNVPDVTARLLDALAKRWPRTVAGVSLARAAGIELRLLPQHMERVAQMCADFMSGPANLL